MTGSQCGTNTLKPQFLQMNSTLFYLWVLSYSKEKKQMKSRAEKKKRTQEKDREARVRAGPSMGRRCFVKCYFI